MSVCSTTPSGTRARITCDLDKVERQGFWKLIVLEYLPPLPQHEITNQGIAQDDFFEVTSGVREGSVLSWILFIIAVDNIFRYL